MAYFSRFSVP